MHCPHGVTEHWQHRAACRHQILMKLERGEAWSWRRHAVRSVPFPIPIPQHPQDSFKMQASVFFHTALFTVGCNLWKWMGIWFMFPVSDTVHAGNQHEEIWKGDGQLRRAVFPILCLAPCLPHLWPFFTYFKSSRTVIPNSNIISWLHTCYSLYKPLFLLFSGAGFKCQGNTNLCTSNALLSC